MTSEALLRAMNALDLRADRAAAEIFEREAERYDRWDNCRDLAIAHRVMAQVCRERAEVRLRMMQADPQAPADA